MNKLLKRTTKESHLCMTVTITLNTKVNQTKKNKPLDIFMEKEPAIELSSLLFQCCQKYFTTQIFVKSITDYLQSEKQLF